MKRSTVSLCMIARDEEATIGTTIKSVLALVDEVIVADTGSQDNTRIIAEGYGARVVDVAWEDDFAAARNIALAEASCEWIIVLDADEIMHPVRPVDFQRLLSNSSALAFRLNLVSPHSADLLDDGNRLRLFRNRSEIRYQYPIFEQISASVQALSEQEERLILDADITVMHDGHALGGRSRKRERNLRILQKAITAYPNEPYFSYKLACEGLLMLDEEVLPVAGIEGALQHLHRSWRKFQELGPDAHQRLFWLPDLGAKICASLLALDKISEARSVIGQVRRLCPDQPQVLLHWVAAETRYLQKEATYLAPEVVRELVDQARAELLRIMNSEDKAPMAVQDRRLENLYPQRYLGELALIQGQVSEAVDHFEKALDLDPAYAAAWFGMAECSRFAGDRKRALKLYLRSVTENKWHHQAWLRGIGLMREMGFNDNAASWWSNVLDMFPEHPVVRANQASADVDDEAAGHENPGNETSPMDIRPPVLQNK